VLREIAYCGPGKSSSSGICTELNVRKYNSGNDFALLKEQQSLIPPEGLSPRGGSSMSSEIKRVRGNQDRRKERASSYS